MTKAARRFAALIVLITLTACSTEPATPPQPEPGEKRLIALDKVVECLAGHKKIPEKEIKDASWLIDGRISPNAEFTNWSSLNAQTKYAGKMLEDWIAEAERADASWKCPFATP